jgi:hypothetical protein
MSMAALTGPPELAAVMVLEAPGHIAAPQMAGMVGTIERVTITANRCGHMGRVASRPAQHAGGEQR